MPDPRSSTHWLVLAGDVLAVELDGRPRLCRCRAEADDGGGRGLAGAGSPADDGDGLTGAGWFGLLRTAGTTPAEEVKVTSRSVILEQKRSSSGWTFDEAGAASTPV